MRILALTAALTVAFAYPVWAQPTECIHLGQSITSTGACDADPIGGGSGNSGNGNSGNGNSGNGNSGNGNSGNGNGGNGGHSG